ncbi:MAG TPA: hypothetical protein VI976_00465 [Candidatus Omnitrophota bacterium]|nr:hypothetical protein [Candidatus Omnitrophota bacterium]
MLRLKDKFKNKCALNIMGGPSVLEHHFNLRLIDRNKFVVFLEAKSLTPKFLEFGLEPDFFMMFFPEKCQTNSFQHVIYQSFLAGIDLSKLLKPQYLEEYDYLKANFQQYFEAWRPQRGPHKKYKLKELAILKNSPFGLLPRLPKMPLIARSDLLEKHRTIPALNNRQSYLYTVRLMEGDFSLEKYFAPEDSNGILTLNSYGHLNSGAIALFPLEAYMGFKKIYFIGMDMSMLGSLEYSSLNTFRSSRHFSRFFKKALPIFNPCFKENKKKFMRPPYEFEDLKSIMSYKAIEFVNIYEPFEFALPLEGIRNISFKQFLNE